MIDAVVLEGLRVLVRAMVERFESKGEIFLWNIGNKVKGKIFSSLGYIAKTMNTKLSSKYRKYFHHDWQLRIDRPNGSCTGLYMNGSRCHEDTWTVEVNI